MDSVPDDFVCPVSLEVMHDPVVCSDGNTYERSAIEKWFLQGHHTSPKTNAELSSTDLIPNHALRAAIESWRASKGIAVASPAPPAPTPAPEVKQPAPVIASPSKSDSEVVATALGYRDGDATGWVRVDVSPPAVGARQPCALICVVDISGSMGSLAALPEANAAENAAFTRMDLVIHSIRTIVSVLNDDDRIAIVTFSDKAEILQPLVKTTKANKAHVVKHVNEMSPDGSTNLWGGLKQGLQLACGLADERCNVATLLFTDGMPNVNPPRGIQAELRSFLGKNSGKCGTIHAFGYGYELDSGLLRDLARTGTGIYGYIPDSTMVGTTFVNMVANALSVCATQVHLQLEPADPKAGVVGIEVVGFEAGQDGETPVGVLQYGQNRTFFVRLKLDKAATDAYLQRPSAPVVKGLVRWQRAGQSSANSPVLVLGLPDKADVMSPSLAVEQCRSLVTLRIGHAMSSANRGAHADARSVIAKTTAEIRSVAAAAGAADEPRVKALLDDLESDDINKGQVSKAFSNEKWYTTWGRHYLPALVQAHLLQQCHNFKDPGVQLYGGNLFRQVQDLANEAFCTLKPPQPSGGAAMASLGGGSGKPSKPAPAPQNMKQYMIRGGGCFDGEGLVEILDDNGSKIMKRVSELRKGDRMAHGDCRVVCVVRSPLEKNATDSCAPQQPLLVSVRGVKLTPWHPVRIDDRWQFPARLPTTIIEPTYDLPVDGFVYNLVLDSVHVVKINALEVVTLGHGISDPVASHPYYGTGCVIDELAAMSGWRHGLVTLRPEVMHDAETGLVSGIFESDVESDSEDITTAARSKQSSQLRARDRVDVEFAVDQSVGVVG